MLEEAGLPEASVHHTFFTLSVYTQGYLLVERKGRDAAGAEEFALGLTSILRGFRPLLTAATNAEGVA